MSDYPYYCGLCGQLDLYGIAGHINRCNPVVPIAQKFPPGDEHRYRDPEKRKAYKRDWARRKRASQV